MRVLLLSGSLTPEGTYASDISQEYLRTTVWRNYFGDSISSKVMSFTYIAGMNQLFSALKARSPTDPLAENLLSRMEELGRSTVETEETANLKSWVKTKPAGMKTNEPLRLESEALAEKIYDRANQLANEGTILPRFPAILKARLSDPKIEISTLLEYLGMGATLHYVRTEVWTERTGNEISQSALQGKAGALRAFLETHMSGTAVGEQALDLLAGRYAGVSTERPAPIRVASLTLLAELEKNREALEEFDDASSGLGTKERRNLATKLAERLYETNMIVGHS